MSYTSFDFPNTHYYDSDLREILAKLKTLLKEYDTLVNGLAELNEWRIEHQGEYEELLVRLSTVEGEINGFETEIMQKFDELSIENQRQLDELKSEVSEEMAQTIEQFQVLYNQLTEEVRSDITSMKLEINSLIRYLNDQITIINQNVIGYVDDRLDEFIAHLPDYENLIVWNPIAGKQTNVQQAINDLYLTFTVYGITAEQYDSLQITAAEFDAKQIEAKEYDMWAYKLLDYPDPEYFMRDPFTGLVVRNKEVIWKLADLHRLALTAAEYDALEIPAETFDGLQLTAYYFDWYGINIGTSAISAGDYDSRNIEAEPYDNMRIGAYDYDNYAQLILSTM